LGGRVSLAHSAVIPQLLFGLAFALANTAGTHRRRSNSGRVSIKPQPKRLRNLHATRFSSQNRTVRVQKRSSARAEFSISTRRWSAT